MFISVIGESVASKEMLEIAEEVGRLIAKSGNTLVCGAGGGVMRAACKGAKACGGFTIGILPTMKKEDANEFIDFPIATGMGFARNALVVRAGEVAIAIGGRYGTLSEIGFALNENKPVIGLQTWEVVKHWKVDQGIIVATTPKEAVDEALKAMKKATK